MNVHGWARHEVEQSLQQARERGFAPGLGLRALLSAVVASARWRIWPRSCSSSPKTWMSVISLLCGLERQRRCQC